MKKTNKKEEYNRFVQEADEFFLVTDGKKKVWDDKTNTFVEYKR